MTTESFRTGFVTVIGRPNVGKSTLINRIVGRKVSISSRRPQTTRHRILGIHTQPASQIVFVDTPGIDRRHRGALNRAMNRVAVGALEGVDAVIWMITARGLTAGDRPVLALAGRAGAPVLLVINKIDRLSDRTRLLPMIDELRALGDFAQIVPLSARSGSNVDALVRTVTEYMPVAPPVFPAGQHTERDDSFMAVELVREQLFRSLGQELPYATAVTLERRREEGGLLCLDLLVWVESAGQKGIVIGKDGARLKSIGAQARRTMERLFSRRVHLSLWVKVREGWADNAAALQTLGYSEGD